MIRITSKRHNFRRCGMPHPRQPVDYPDDRFSDEELKILQAEPRLTVEIIDDGEICRSKDPDKLTVPEIKKLLDTLEIEYPAKAAKADLLMLLKENTAEPPEE